MAIGAALAAFQQGEGASLGGGTSSADPTNSMARGGTTFNIASNTGAGVNPWVMVAGIGASVLLIGALMRRR